MKTLRMHRRLFLAAILLSSSALLPPFAIGQDVLDAEPSAEDEEPDSRFRHPLEPVDLEAFLDGVMGIQLRDLPNVGATVAVVKDGEIILSKGYGFADLEARKPVDPETTMFRIGSVTKLFVWTSVMQLVEEGSLDLHADINGYLNDFQVPSGWDEPVTLAHLMTHSPGFEDRVVGLFSRQEKHLRPLAEVLNDQTPARVRPPGDQPSYSNHGTAMAALAVETVAQKPWIQFVQERILDPLGMTHTTLAQPPSDPFAEQMSKGYSDAGDHFEEEEFELVPLYPAGTASASANDMARLMIAFLQNGRFEDSVILQEETALQMQLPLLEVAPQVNSSPHGFMDMSTRGIRIIGHGGDTLWFHTMFAMFPDHGIGFFVSYNTDSGGGGRGPLLEAFLDRYFSPAERPGPAPDDFSNRASRFSGQFRANRNAHTTLAKLGALAGAFELTTTDDGELQVFDDRFVETSPGVFTARDGETKLVFVDGEDGSISHFYNAQFPIMTFERVPASESRSLHLGIAVIAGVFFLGTVLAWPLGWAIRKWFAVEGAPRIPKSARLALWATAALLLAMVMGLAMAVGDPEDLVFGELGKIRAVLMLPILALIPAIVALVATVRIWRFKLGTATGRLLYTISALLIVPFYWQLTVWNLLGFKL